jgi:hypothetical protein
MIDSCNTIVCMKPHIATILSGMSQLVPAYEDIALGLDNNF